MAGAGFKTWVNGDVLTAPDVNTYLMEQAVMVFADGTARDTALPSPSEGMHAFTKDNDTLWYYDGAAWQPYVDQDVIEAKGDLIVGTADDAVGRLAVGANNTLLVADSGESTGVKWSSTITNAIVQGVEESWNVAATAATGTVDFDTLTSTAWLYTSDASGNWTLNVRGDGSTTLASLLDTGDSITVVFAVTQGATPYYNSAFQIDGSSVTPEWQGGAAPAAGNASSVDVYVYTIIKTAATPTYTVLASQTQFA